MASFYDLLQPPEEELDLPALAIHLRDDERLRIFAREVGGQQDDLVGPLQPDDPNPVMLPVFLRFAHPYPCVALITPKPTNLYARQYKLPAF